MSTADPQTEDVPTEGAPENTSDLENTSTDNASEDTGSDIVEPTPAPVVHVVKRDPKTGEHLGTGRRKSSVARVRLKPGNGKIQINGRELAEYFPNLQDQNWVMAPLLDCGYADKVDVRILVSGGGPSGQSGACRMGLGRALLSIDENVGHQLKDNGHLTRDSRMKERKKYGLHGARRGTQFSKR